MKNNISYTEHTGCSPYGIHPQYPLNTSKTQGDTAPTDSETQSNTSRKPFGKLSGIDGLKGIAILGVTFFHLLPLNVPGGYLGVSLFLLLTGYLLAYSSIKEFIQHRYSVKNYFIKRIKRIYPALIIVILVTIGVNALLIPKSINGIRMEVLSILLGYNNIWQIFQNADYFTRLTNTSPFTHLWFLGIEIQYFVLWPILFWIFRKICKKVSYQLALTLLAVLALGMAAVMPILYEPGQDVTRLYYGTDTRIYALLFGAFLGILKAHQSHHQEDRSLTGWQSLFFTFLFIALMVGLVIGYFYLDGQNPIVYQYMMLVATFGFCLLVRISEYDTLKVNKVLDTLPLRWLGQRSYGIFLWQYPVIYLFQKLRLAEHFDNALTYNGTILLIIILLTLWSDAVTDKIVKAIELNNLFNWAKRVSLTTTTIFGVAIMCFGLYAFMTASGEKINDLNELQSRLAANESAQAEANKKARELTDTEKSQVDASLSGVSAIGDSVMLGASPSLRKVLPNVYIDAKVSRYVGAGLDIAKGMSAENSLSNVVLIGLGTNGPITDYYEDETKSLVSYLGPDREIFWVNIYGPNLDWEKSNNAYLEKLAKEHKNITIINWHDLVAKHPEWLADDGVHPNDLGIEEYAKLVHDTMKDTLTKKQLAKDEASPSI